MSRILWELLKKKSKLSEPKKTKPPKSLCLPAVILGASWGLGSPFAMSDYTHGDTHTQAHTMPSDRAAEHMQADPVALLAPCSSSPAPDGHDPYCNTGSHFHQTPKITQSTLKSPSFRFDWYEATLDKEVEPLEVLRWAQFFGESAPFKGVQGYETGHDFGQFKVMYGGHSGQWGVHVIIHGGDLCADIVQSFRTYFPEHRPSRIDVCVDFQGPSSFEELHGFCSFVCKKFGVETRLYGDWENKKKGRTYYGGGKGSTHKFRLYEKGHEMRSKGVDPNAPLDWVRLEFQIAPARPARQKSAFLDPDQVARSTKWTTFLCDLVGTTSADRVNLTTKKVKPDVIDSFEHMCGQYCATIHQTQKEGLIPRKDFIRIMLDIYDKGHFNGLPETCYRNWYF